MHEGSVSNTYIADFVNILCFKASKCLGVVVQIVSDKLLSEIQCETFQLVF